MTNVDHGGVVPPDDLVWPPPPVPDDRPRRGPRWWWLALTAAVVLVAALGFGLRPVRHPTAVPPLAAPAATVTAEPAPAPVTVVYLVTGATGDIGSVQYTDEDGDIVNRAGIALPWRVTFQVTGTEHAFVIVAQRKKGGDGAVTCSITVGGKLLSSARETGHYAAPECSA